MIDLPTTRPLDGLSDPIDPAPNPEALAILNDSRRHIAELLRSTLGWRDASIISELYAGDMTAFDVGAVLGLTEKQVDYIRWKSLRILRKHPQIRSLLTPHGR